ncbi:unnamed protein product [Trichobilharzia szidati]|nr:unnamed protein product [Trichobilharzia szidati]
MFLSVKTMKWAYPICPRITTIGRNGCDIIIDNPTIDPQHAVIEQDPSTGLLTLRDLSSRKGTFVNDHNIDGEVVRLSVGDKIRFGCCSTIYEVTSPDRNLRESFTGTQPVDVDSQDKTLNKLLVIPDGYAGKIPPWIKVCNNSDASQINLPRLVSKADTCHFTPMLSIGNKMSTFSCRESDKNYYEDRPSSRTANICNSSQENPAYYMKASAPDNSQTSLSPNLSMNETLKRDVNSDEKDKFIQHLQEQINRLAPLEAISTQKDILIKHLQNQISQMNHINKLFHQSGNYAQNLTARSQQFPSQPTLPSLIDNNSQTDIIQHTFSPTNQIPYHVQQLQQPPQQPQENHPIRIRPGSTPSQIKLCTNKSIDSNNSDVLVNDQECKTNSNNDVTDVQLLEKVRRERQILSGLVTQLQKDLSNKDIQMCRLNKELSQIKNQLAEKDTTIDALHMKYNKSQDKRQQNKEKEQFEKEIDDIRQKYKTAELRCHSLQDELQKLKSDYDRLNHEAESKSNNEGRLRKELEETQIKLTELERTNRINSLDKHEAVSQCERLRTRVMRIVFGVLSADHHCIDTKIATIKNDDTSKSKEQTSASQKSTSSDKSSVSSSVHNTDDDDNDKTLIVQDVNNTCHDGSHDEQLLDRVQYLADDYKRLQHEIQANTLEENKRKEKDKGLEKELEKFISVYTEAQEHMKDTPRFRSSLRLKQEIELLAAYVPPSDIIKKLQRILLDDLQDQVNTQQRLEDCTQEAVGTIQSQNSDLHISNRPDDLVSTIRRLVEMTSTIVQQKNDLLKQMKTTEIEHQEELIKTKSLVQNEWKSIMDDTIAKLNYENADKIQKAVEEVSRVENMRQEQILSVKETLIEELENKLRETRQILAEKQITYENELNEAKEASQLVPILKQQIETKDNQIDELKCQLDKQNLANENLKEEIEKACELHWKSEVDSHREQIRQHARTICVMEERLVKLTKQLKESKSEVTKLKRTNTELQNEHKQLQIRLTDAHNRLQSMRKTSARHGDDMNRQPQPSSDSCSDENSNAKLIENLRHEISRLQTIIKDQTNTIEVLHSDLSGTQAQLSDLKGELTESQKLEIEETLNNNKKMNTELMNTKAQLTRLKESSNEMHQQLNEKDDVIRKQKSAIQELHKLNDENESTIKRLKDTIDHERHEYAKRQEQMNSSSKLTQELIALGTECKGERHHEIISKQREALSQLRQRLRSQFTYTPSQGNAESDEYIRQISFLKRENAELRSKALLSEVVPSLNAITNNSPPALGDGSDSDPFNDPRLPIDNIGLRNAMDALHTSEECYLNLVRSISNHLEIDRLPGQRSLIQVPKIERENVKKERQNTIELLSQRIEILRNQLQAKEDLLNEYERDINRLKQAEALADAKSEQVEHFISELQSKTTEIQLLRQSLENTREALMNEQRTVAALKKSRTSTPNSNVSSIKVNQTPKKQVRQSDEQNFKEQRQKKMNQEKLKRKDYEIDALKTELEARDKKLHLLSDQMMKMRIQMGLEDGVK